MWKNPNFILSFCLMSIRLVIALLNQVHHNKKIINPTKKERHLQHIYFEELYMTNDYTKYIYVLQKVS